MNRDPSLAFALTTSITLVSWVNAQIDDGRALDANPLVGSGGYNDRAYDFVPNSSDLIITGNVTAGRAFRGFSPIRSQHSLLADIPSSSLSNFQRDSFGISNYQPGSYVSGLRPYFAPERAITSIGSISAGVNLPGSSYGAGSFIVPRADLNAPWNDDVARRSPLDPPAIRLPALALTSPMAAPRTDDSMTESNTPLYTPDQATGPLDSPAGALPTVTQPNPGAVNGLPTAGTTFSGQADSSTARLTFDDMSLRSRTTLSPTAHQNAQPGLSAPGLPTTEGISRTLVYDPLEPAQPAPPEGETEMAYGAPGAGVDSGLYTSSLSLPESASDTSVAFQPSGLDPLNDFQDALTWLEENSSRIEDDAEVSAADQASHEIAEKIVNQTWDSFAGQMKTLEADYVRNAEQALKNGDVRRAVSMYRLASGLDPTNPLIDLGLGHAYLLAGDFNAAVLMLTRGIERFPRIGFFRIDLSKFLTDPTLLDLRRAELERLLAHQEDAKIRFLLGYAEYYSGLPQFGMENLKKAAAAAPKDSLIARFPEMLESK